jgi:chromosome segregation ATPase
VEERFLEVDRRFDQVDERFREVLGHFDELYRRLERLEQEYYAISQQRRIEAVLTDESGRREILERDLAALKDHVGLLQARSAEIERRLGA